MARPVKNFCDYFPHDRDMRNHRKVKAIRNKFGITGYGIWSMLLEYLTGIDGNEFENSDIEFELMAGDFGVSATEIRQVVDYAVKLEMIFEKNGFIHSESLDERLNSVYEKRKVNKSKSKKQLRVDGKFAKDNTVTDGITVTETPQSKVNKSKENELPKIKFLIPEMFTAFQVHLPKYPGVIEDDYKPLEKIAVFLNTHLKLNGDIVKNKDTIVDEWSKISVVIAGHDWYQTKPLSIISSQFQEIYQIHKYGNIKPIRTNSHNTSTVGKTIEMDNP